MPMPTPFIDPEPDSIEDAALAIIAETVPESALPDPVLAAYIAVLADEHVFNDMVWPDARALARIIADVLADTGDPVAALLSYARDTLAGTDRVVWRDRVLVTAAFVTAANALGVALGV